MSEDLPPPVCGIANVRQGVCIRLVGPRDSAIGLNIWLMGSVPCFFPAHLFQARIFVDFHGHAIAEHVADRAFSLRDEISALRVARLGWREIFWRLFASLHVFRCARCGQGFVATEWAQCPTHASNPVWMRDDDNMGTYPCCGAPATRFERGEVLSGCVFQGLSHLRNPPITPVQLRTLIFHDGSIV